MNKICVRLEKPILMSKYAEIVSEMTKRNLGAPVAYSTVLSTGNITTITFNPENINAFTGLLSNLDIRFNVI